MLEGHGDHYVPYHATTERLGEKGQRHQSSEHLRHGNNCSAISVTICLLHRIASSHPWLIRRRMLLGVVSLIGGSTTGLLMSPWYGGYQTTTPPPYYPKATYATTSSCTEVFKYYTIKAPEF
ncbi:hypothetical protein DAPPUDRAFT_235273 [Daphnia pulex]|uniref:Uncharacterized protein n=1 Tax=Daphnia pulex TaxID=6669 RepID=E9FYN0_DAPPU|nr:hypothetical protein DAPPUDRAFT_235273 [Daphnia pulex]|eukprot:EFX87742.1 hypothetical protein DAPPUDRAFT_235273 [Daphnia pulex]